MTALNEAGFTGTVVASEVAAVHEPAEGAFADRAPCQETFTPR